MTREPGARPATAGTRGAARRKRPVEQGVDGNSGIRDQVMARLIRELAGRGKLYITSNRGPNEYQRRRSRWVVRRAPGGVVSLLNPLFRQPDVVWLACAMSDSDRAFVRQRGIGTIVGDQVSKLADMRYVVPTPEEFVRYYGTIANELLWPLQHGLFTAEPGRGIDPRFFEAWGTYRRMNERFARAIADNDAADPAVLVHDYHLYLLPGMLRACRPGARILHFTHIPWPAPSAWGPMPAPMLAEIIESLAAADIIGFQTELDARNFLATARTMLPAGSVDWKLFELHTPGHRALVRWYPAAPDFRAVTERSRRPAVQTRRDELADLLGERTILRVDRLDPAKNLLAGFEAFREAMLREPRRLADTRMLAWLVPSRTDLHAYRSYAAEVFRRIEEINRELGRPGRPEPIAVVHRNDRDLAFCAMQCCDVLLANSIADGMNLVVKEALILGERGSVPVVSRTAGVCAELERWLIPVDAPDVHGTASALLQALDTPLERRLANQTAARHYLREHDATHWVTAQLRDLRDATVPFMTRVPAARRDALAALGL